MTLKELISLASKTSERLFRRDGEVYALYHLVRSDGTTGIWSPGASNIRDKDEMVRAARIVMREMDIERYVFIDEAWIVEGSHRPAEEREKLLRFAERYGASNHPDRREVLMFYGECKSGEQLMAYRYILRPEYGKPTLSPGVKFFDKSAASGRITRLLQP